MYCVYTPSMVHNMIKHHTQNHWSMDKLGTIITLNCSVLASIPIRFFQYGPSHNGNIYCGQMHQHSKSFLETKDEKDLTGMFLPSAKVVYISLIAALLQRSTLRSQDVIFSKKIQNYKLDTIQGYECKKGTKGNYLQS